MQGQQIKFDSDRMLMGEHIESVHLGDEGYTALLTVDMDGNPEQRHYLYNDLILMAGCAEIDGQKNYFISPNTFYKPCRRVENVRHIRSLYADLDCHHLDPHQMEPAIKEAIEYFKNKCEYERFPMPSIIVNTGRGLQLYWLIEDLPKQAVPRWKMVQDAITDRLKEAITGQQLNITVDNISDISRVLRLCGTNNTKANKLVTFVINEPTRYRLDNLIDEYFTELKPIGEPRKKKSSYTKGDRKTIYIFNLYSLHYARLQDLVKLQELRKGDIASDECRRRMVFLYRYWGNCYLQDTQRALQEALEFNKGFTHPLPENVVKTATASAEKAYHEWLSGATVEINGQAYRKGYNYRNSTLIKWLDITPEEQRKMQTIISTEEKYRRKNEARNSKRYGKDESGLTAKQRERLVRDERILKMHEQGLSNREIAKKMQIGETTVRRALERVRRF